MFLCLSLVFFTSCAKQPTAPDKPKFTDGRLSGGAYINDVIGMDIPIPKNWVARLSTAQRRQDTLSALLVEFLSPDSSGPFRTSINVVAGATKATSMNCEAQAQALQQQFSSDSSWSKLTFSPADQVLIGGLYACDTRFMGDFASGAHSVQHVAIRQSVLLRENYVVAFTLADSTGGFNAHCAMMDTLFQNVVLH
jgi:hypothetical protein